MIGPNEFYDVVAADDENTEVEFGKPMTSIRIQNDNPAEGDSVFITLASRVATLESIEVKAGELFQVTLPAPTDGIGLICNNSETASVRVAAWGG